MDLYAKQKEMEAIHAQVYATAMGELKKADVTEADVLKVVEEFRFAMSVSAFKVNKWGKERIGRTPLKLHVANSFFDQTIKIVFGGPLGGGTVGLTLGKDLHFDTVDELRKNIKTLLVQHANNCIQSEAEKQRVLPQEWLALMTK